MIKNMKHAVLNISIATVFLNAQILKMNIKNINFWFAIAKNCQRKFNEKLKEQCFNT